jgi:hypothetical protein
MPIDVSQVQPGQIQTLIVEIDDKDYSKLCTSVEIYQDIFSPTWSANMMLMDSVNIQTNDGITVGSEVFIELETSDNKPCGKDYAKQYHFVINNISDKILIKKRVYGYKISMITKELYISMNNRVSKYYGKMPPNEIVNKILQDGGVGGEIEADDDPTQYDVIIPNWTPFVAINWVAQFAQVPSKGADFVFFQSDDEQKYKFKSVEKMFEEESTDLKYITKERGYRKNSISEDEDSFLKINKFQMITELDGLRNTAMGFFGNKSIEHDIVDKKITEYEYTYSEDAPDDKTKKPFKGDHFEDSTKSSISFRTKHIGMTDGAPNPAETHDKWRGSRKSHQMKLETNRLLIEVAGSACLWDTLGKTIYLEIHPQEDKSKENLDKYYKGDWLVMAIRQTVNITDYVVVFELGKKRLEIEIEDEL